MSQTRMVESKEPEMKRPVSSGYHSRADTRYWCAAADWPPSGTEGASDAGEGAPWDGAGMKEVGELGLAAPAHTEGHCTVPWQQPLE